MNAQQRAPGQAPTTPDMLKEFTHHKDAFEREVLKHPDLARISWRAATTDSGAFDGYSDPEAHALFAGWILAMRAVAHGRAKP